MLSVRGQFLKQGFIKYTWNRGQSVPCSRSVSLFDKLWSVVDLKPTWRPGMQAAHLPPATAVSPCQLKPDALMPGRPVREKVGECSSGRKLGDVGDKTEGWGWRRCWSVWATIQGLDIYFAHFYLQFKKWCMCAHVCMCAPVYISARVYVYEFCMCMHVCMCACVSWVCVCPSMRLYMCASMYAYMWVCACASGCKCTCTCICLYVYAHTACVCMYVHMLTRICINSCIYLCIYTRVHTTYAVLHV